MYLLNNVDVKNSSIVIDIMSNTFYQTNSYIKFINIAIKNGYKLTADDKELIRHYPNMESMIANDQES
jgi:hypothetical protein